MKKYILPILFMSLFYWSCEEEQDCSGEPGGNNICGCTDSTATNYNSTATFNDESCEYDTTPPTVTITSPEDGYIINLIPEIVTITCMSFDNEGVQKVELWVNGVSTGIIDDIEPYSFDWNTATLGDGNYTIIIRAYDTNDNITDSEPIILTVHKTKVILWGQTYLIEETDTLSLLYDNGVTGSIPPEIGNLTNLTWLYLRGNNLTGSIPPEIGNLTNLTFFYLRGNNLTGSIPSEIGNLTNLTDLRLQDNQLTGSIPSELGNLTNLDYLDLHNNQLTGSIPSEIGNLTNLMYLILFNNQLTGEIPESICDLNISWDGWDFNISNNQLCPPYPSCIEEYVGEQDTTNCD